MTEKQRVFCRDNITTGLTEWFFPAREGTFGPFGSKEIAETELDAFVKNCIKNHNDGGRRFGNKSANSSPEPLRK